MADPEADASLRFDPSQRRYRGCAKITDYEITDKLGEGTFGVVSKGRSRRTGAVVALKKILMHNEKDGFPITALREIKLLKMLSHPNVLKLDEMAVERKKGDGKRKATLYMVTPYMDHDLSGMTTNPDIDFSLPQIKCYMMQLLEGLRYLHDSNILHRDMKAANILISNKGMLQIADFGLARHYEGPTPKSGRGNGEAVRDYTTLVVTRWYRPPELLLQLRRYTPAIDMWGAGCVFAEMFERKPILEGKSDLNQAEIIFELLGSPTEDTMPGWANLPGCEGVRQWGTHRGNIGSRFGRLGPEGLDLLRQLLKLDWRSRINAYDALKHEYFKVRPLPAMPEDIPQFEESHELDRRKHHEKRAALPPAPAGGTVGMGPDDRWVGSGPPPDGFSNGYGGHRDRGRYNQRDRGPPGAGPANGPPRGSGHHDSRGPPPPPHRDYRDDASRRPAWQREGDSRGPPPPPPRLNGDRLPAPAGQHALPPRPAGPLPGPRDRDRDLEAGPAPPRGDSNRDTYIPRYSDGRPPAARRGDEEPAVRDRDRDYDDRRRGSKDRGYRERERDRPDRDRGDRHDRDRGERAERDHRRTRSRSPDRGESHRERRERLQDREREFYRR